MERPNILFILCDQFRRDCLGVMGHPVVRTPNLDEMAYNGTCFTSAYSATPSCIPARASLLTGKNADNTGFLGYRDKVNWDFENMLPEVLRNNGYQTHCTGKTHFYPQRKHCGFEGLDSYESMQKFDEHYENDYFEWLREKTGGLGEENMTGTSTNSWVARPSSLPEELHVNSWTVTKALEFIKRRDHTRPYFLNVSFHRPHPPIDPPRVYWDEYMALPYDPPKVGGWAGRHEGKVKSVSEWHGNSLGEHDIKKCRHGYYAQIAHIDSQIGRLLMSLGRMRETPDLIIFTSDHGEMLFDHNLYRKTYAYEASAGVPLIIRTKDKPARFRCDAPVVLEDIYATILDFAGIAPPPDIDGVSLMPAHTCGEPIARDFIHGEHAACYSKNEAMQYLTDGKYKYIWFTKTGEEQLFDLQKDPYERDDLSGDPDHSETLEKWRKNLIEILAKRPYDGLSDGEKLICGLLPPCRAPGGRLRS